MHVAKGLALLFIKEQKEQLLFTHACFFSLALETCRAHESNLKLPPLRPVGLRPPSSPGKRYSINHLYNVLPLTPTYIFPLARSTFEVLFGPLADRSLAFGVAASLQHLKGADHFFENGGPSRRDWQGGSVIIECAEPVPRTGCGGVYTHLSK